MNIKNTKYFFYFFHMIYIFSTLIIPFFLQSFIFLQLLTIVTWVLNDNNCLLTQIEDYLYGNTLIEIVYGKKKFKVPLSHRILLIVFFCYNIFTFSNLII